MQLLGMHYLLLLSSVWYWLISILKIEPQTKIKTLIVEHNPSQENFAHMLVFFCWFSITGTSHTHTHRGSLIWGGLLIDKISLRLPSVLYCTSIKPDLITVALNRLIMMARLTCRYCNAEGGRWGGGAEMTQGLL